MNTLKTFLWILKMSMRELRSHFFSLLPLILTLGLGLGTALGIDTLSQQIKITLDAEAQSLLGGDLDVSLAREFPEALLAELKNLPEAQNQVKWWRCYFRLQIRALEFRQIKQHIFLNGLRRQNHTPRGSMAEPVWV